MARILVIGRGRCGTKAVALALQKMGLDVQHEAIGKGGSVNNEWAHDVNGRPSLAEFEHIWHVVREPTANIASMHTFAWTTGPAPQMPLAQKYWDDLTARCAASYYEWNLECEATLQEAAALGAHTWRFRIEDDWIQVAARLLGKEPVEIPNNVNTRIGAPNHPGQLTWDQVLAGLGINEKAGLLEMAKRYGYEAPRMVIDAKKEADKTTAGQSVARHAGVLRR
jgi:hypothetical protein